MLHDLSLWEKFKVSELTTDVFYFVAKSSFQKYLRLFVLTSFKLIDTKARVADQKLEKYEYRQLISFLPTNFFMYLESKY